MRLTITLRNSHLKVFSSLLTDSAAGLFLTLAAAGNIWILLTNLFFAMICIGLAITIEDNLS